MTHSAAASAPIARLAALAVALGAALAVGQAAAQVTDRRWTSPDGALIVSIPDAWTMVSPHQPTGSVLAIHPAARADGVVSTACAVQMQRNLRVAGEDNAPVTQELNNASLERWIAQGFPEQYGRDTIVRSSSEFLAGVRVFSFDVRYENSQTGEGRKARFLSVAATGASFRLFCSYDAASTAEELAAADRFLSSIELIEPSP